MRCGASRRSPRSSVSSRAIRRAREASPQRRAPHDQAGRVWPVERRPARRTWLSADMDGRRCRCGSTARRCGRAISAEALATQAGRMLGQRAPSARVVHRCRKRAPASARGGSAPELPQTRRTDYLARMIPRYARPEAAEIWSPQTPVQDHVRDRGPRGRRDGRARRDPQGRPPSGSGRSGRDAVWDVERIDEIERETKHDVIAFLTHVAEIVGPEARFLHQGMTSSDVLDTALAVQLTPRHRPAARGRRPGAGGAEAARAASTS